MKTVGKEIIDALNEGSEPAFAALYEVYFSYLCACAATYVPDPVSAEEIVNDVFVHIWEHRGGYRAPMHGYLVSSVRNACISHIRSQLFRRRLREGYERELLLFARQQCLSDAQPLEMLSAQEVEERIRAIVETLPERCRVVFEHYFYRGESASQIARDLRINPVTVRVQIKNALDRLRAELGPLVTACLLTALFKS